ncbi:MAG: hypothetical protein PCFJNLEI_00641 [Verrucomicrobiae bacterium]|nr:hypothetical protein [Verrucomicrobiae bacterium]
MRTLVMVLLTLWLSGQSQAEPRRVLAVRGLWYELYQCDSAFAALGGVRSVNVWHSPNSVSGPFPSTAEEMARYDLVILANINGQSLSAEGRALLKWYVAQGGAVLMLGGYYAFGGEYHGTELEEIAPVEFSADPNLVAIPTGARLTPVKGDAQPHVFWRHNIRTKPGATVVLTADEQPLLVTGTFGQGRVAVFAGSVMGDPPAGRLAFWEWSQWPAVLAQAMTWLAPSARARPGKAAVLAQLQAATTGTNAVEQLLEAAAPVADQDFAVVAKALIDSGRLEKVALGLRLLGLSRVSGAKEQLRMAFTKGVTAPPKQSLDDLLADALEHKSSGVDPDLNPTATKAAIEKFQAVQLAAVDGLGWLGDPAALGVLHEIVRQNPARVLAPGEFNESFTEADERRESALIAALRCGDAGAAGPVVDSWMQNLYTLAALKIRGAGAKPADSAVQRSRLVAAHARLTIGLERLPKSVWPAVAKRVAAEEDRWIVPLAFAVFGQAFNNDQALPAEVAAILRQSKLPAVAALAIGASNGN